MRCKRIKGLLQSYLDDSLKDEEYAIVKDHLEKCKKCQKEFHLLKRVVSFIEKTPTIEPSEDFTLQVMNRIPSPTQQTFVFKRAFSLLDSLFALPTSRWAYVTVTALLLVVLFILPNYVSQVYQIQVSSEQNFNVDFTLFMPEAKSVSLVGDFNGWDPEVHKFVKKGNRWEIKLKLKPGIYQYMFLIDGKQWIVDPKASKYVSDSFGGKNALIEIPAT
jgi:hypothetical protein